MTRLHIMNPSTTPPTLDLEKLRKAVQEYQPNPRRIPFNNLKPLHDSIADMRRKCASYATIAELLQQHGVKTSRARVAEYGRTVLEGGKTRKRRRPRHITPAPALPVAPPIEPKPQVSSAQASPPYESRSGPRIARVRLIDGSIAGEKRQTPG